MLNELSLHWSTTYHVGHYRSLKFNQTSPIRRLQAGVDRLAVTLSRIPHASSAHWTSRKSKGHIWVRSTASEMWFGVLAWASVTPGMRWCNMAENGRCAFAASFLLRSRTPLLSFNYILIARLKEMTFVHQSLYNTKSTLPGSKKPLHALPRCIAGHQEDYLFLLRSKGAHMLLN